MSGFPRSSGGGISPPAGDIGGTVLDPLVVGLDGIPIVGTPTSGQFLEYNGTDYVPTTAGSSSLALTPTAVKTANYNANAGDLVPANASAGSFTITLPTAPADKTLVGAISIVAPGASDVVTIACGAGDSINVSGTSSDNIRVGGEAKLYQYSHSAAIWYRISNTPVNSLLSYIMTAANIEATFTAKGNLYIGTGAGSGEQLATGAAGQLLQVGGADASGLEWADLLTPVTTAINITAAAGQLIDDTAGVTVTLPTPFAGALVAVVRDGSHNTVITPAGTNTINGVNASVTLAITGQVVDPAVLLVGLSSTAWIILATAGQDLGQGLRVAGTLNYNGSLLGHLSAKTGNYTVAAGDSGLSFNGAFTATFGTGLTAGQIVFIQNIAAAGANPVTLAAAGSGSISGPTTISPGNGALCYVVSAGASPVVYVVAVSGTTPGLPGTIWLTTRWYPQQLASGTALLTVGNTGYALPLVVTETHEFTGLGVNLTIGGTGGAPVIHFGIYADNGNGYPGALVLDAGSAVATGTGAITVTGLTQVLTPGLYWLVAVPQGATTTQPTAVSPSTTAPGGYPVFFGSSNAGVNTTALGYSLAALATGALPNPFTAGATPTAASSLITVQAQAA